MVDARIALVRFQFYNVFFFFCIHRFKLIFLIFHFTIKTAGKYRGANDINAEECISCGKGLYQENVASATCLPCIPGKFMDDDRGFSACKDCIINTFSDDTKQFSCKICPTGYLAQQKGSASCQMCVVSKLVTKVT